MKTNQIVVLGFATQEDCELGRGAVVEDTYCDTLAEAKKRARYILTDDFMRMGEMSEPLRYSQVLVNGECHSDFFVPKPSTFNAMTNQPIWKLVAQLGDVHPLEYGGLFVYEDTTGVYPPEAAKLFPPEDDMDLDSPKARWTEYRFILEPCTFQGGILSDNKFHPESPAWFAKNIASVAGCIGQSPEELIAALVSGSTVEKAVAWEAIGNYHGCYNLDDYPLSFTRAEIEARYPRNTWKV